MTLNKLRWDEENDRIVRVDGNGGTQPVPFESLVTEQARFEGSPWYDVTAYGAEGDGETDDSAAITAAIEDAAEDDQATVYYPPGEYVADNLPIPTNVSHIGAGRVVSTITVPSGSTDPIFVADETEEWGLGITFMHLGLFGDGRNQHGLDFEGYPRIDDTIIFNCYLEDLDHGIHGSQDDRQVPYFLNRIRDCNVGIYVVNNHPYVNACTIIECETGIGGDPYHMPIMNTQITDTEYGIRGLDGGILSKSRIWNCRFPGNIQAIELGINNQVSNVQIDPRDETGETGILINGRENHIQNVMFESDHDDQFSKACFVLGAELGSSRNKISGCHADDVGAFFVYEDGVDDELYGWIISDAHIRVNDTQAMVFDENFNHGRITDCFIQFEGGDIGDDPLIDIETYFGYTFSDNSVVASGGATVGPTLGGEGFSSLIVDNKMRRTDGIDVSTDGDTIEDRNLLTG